MPPLPASPPASSSTAPVTPQAVLMLPGIALQVPAAPFAAMAGPSAQASASVPLSAGGSLLRLSGKRGKVRRRGLRRFLRRLRGCLRGRPSAPPPAEAAREVEETSQDLSEHSDWPAPPSYLKANETSPEFVKVRPPPVEESQSRFQLQDEADNLSAVPQDASLQAFRQQRDFWKWSAGVGWALDFVLLCWALFLRSAGLAPGSPPGEGQALPTPSLKFDRSTYADLVASQFQEERYVSESDLNIKTVQEGLKVNLESLRDGAETLLKPTEEQPPKYDDVVLSQLIGDVLQQVENDGQVLAERAEQLLKNLQEKPVLLRELAEQWGQLDARMLLRGGAAGGGSLGISPSELPRFLQESLVPVILVLGSFFLVAFLSQQFLTVVTEWRRRREETKAERMRKIQLRRFQTFRDVLSGAMSKLVEGNLDEAAKAFDQAANFTNRWMSEPTWEELLRAELTAFWERWGPEAYKLQVDIGDWKRVPKTSSVEQAKFVADRWFSSAQSVVKDAAMDAVKAWGEEASRAASAARRAAQLRSPQGFSQRAGDDARPLNGHKEGTGLVIRIFGRWPAPEAWVNIANLPLVGDWREQALRLLLPSAKDVQDVPLLGPVSEEALTTVVSSQVKRAISTSAWGSLTTDLWRRGIGSSKSHEGFQIGYEVVEVESQVREEMCALARAMPRSGTPGRVVRVRSDLESVIEEIEAR
eukprot:TRINITY_DN13580_c0_g1_i2.p1 TRINITY_DN13580_c0_g1~~TRINITY_DN13580_c0_g1_i2.p1  ORF type:complete len:758 (-),score=172.62 TRINITY_DN13580_c0_g1_i2:60-2162(-)